jgi:hypothetical protein
LAELGIKLCDKVFVFSLPVPHDRLPKDEISIEHYFTDDEIKTEFEGKRLYFYGEFCKTGVSLDETKHCKRTINNKFDIKILSHDQDTNVTDLAGNGNFLLSKAIFATKIDEEFEDFANFNFEEFSKIFDIISKILQDT